MTNPTTLEMTPLTHLLSIRHRKNPRQHATDDIVASIRRNGFKAPPMVDRGSSTMVAGHGRCLALERMRFEGDIAPDGVALGDRGEWLVPALYSTFRSESDRDAYLLADNRITELGSYDDTLLSELLTELDETEIGLDGTGYTHEDLEQLLGGDDPAPEDVPGREIPIGPGSPHTRTIGAHKVRPPAHMTHDDWKLELGDCLDGLRRLADNSVDAVVTDPPAGISFMGRAWDSDKGGRDRWIEWLQTIMAECLRVLKPGGHLLSWALPRTSHWTALAIDNAGFEIRDVVYHCFGTGFPKSLDVSKAVDARLGAPREIVGETIDRRDDGTTYGLGHTGEMTSPEPNTAAAAAALQGVGTALKPAVEPWILARKPLDGTIAENAIAWGTGGLNIDACRVPHANLEDQAEATPQGAVTSSRSAGATPDLDGSERVEFDRPDTSLGRWPAPLVLSHSDYCVPVETDGEERYRCVIGCPVRIIDEQGGAAPDELGVSRFYYCPKPSKAETEAGLEDLPLVQSGELTGGRADGSAGLDNPRAGAGRTGPRANTHPSKKSIALMRWLVRLVTPAAGLVLDPFAGSGTTGLAAIAEGCKFLGFEKEDEYHRIASERLRTFIDAHRADAESATPETST